MAYYLLITLMLYERDKKDLIDTNIFFEKKEQNNENNDIFSSLKHCKNIQEVWINAINIGNSFFLIPHTKSLQKFKKKKFYNFFSYTSHQNNKYKTKQKFLITDISGNSIGTVDLVYNYKDKYIYIKEINYSKGYSLSLLEKVIKNLLNYYRKIFYLNKFFISIKKDDTKLKNFFIRVGFLKYLKETQYLENDFNYYWEEINKSIGKKVILTAGPSISSSEAFKTYDAAKRGWNNEWNKYINELENNFAKYIGVKYAISTSSCTGALHIALVSLGISKGDEVIVPDITWVATARVISYLGATPIFADIDKNNWNLDFKSVEKLITKKTKAIIPVHLYGNPVNLEKLKKLSLKYKIKLVEDAAPALGSSYKGRMCGSVGNFSAFSFQGAKLLVAGEGGMLCTNNYSLYKTAKKISNHGRNPNKTFWIDGPGLKYKISNIQAAFASSQLERIDHLILMKRRIFNWYKKYLKNNNYLNLLEEDTNSYSNYWMVSIFLKNNKNNKRDKLIKFLRKHNIDTRPVFNPISEYPIWNRKQKINKTAKLIGYSSLNLPSGTALTEREVIYICTKINIFFNLRNL